MTECPGSTEAGCRCWEHDPGLAAYAADPVVYERALVQARGKRVKLRIVTPEPIPVTAKTFDGVIPFEKPCDGSMVCDCKGCTSERTARVKRGGIGSGAPQPWRPRRRARIAA